MEYGGLKIKLRKSPRNQETKDKGGGGEMRKKKINSGDSVLS